MNILDTEQTQSLWSEKSWRHLPQDLYGGTVPFDSRSVVKTYQNGIGLCLNHPDFDHDALTTNRILKPASSAVMNAQPNEFLTKHFGIQSSILTKISHH